MVNSEQVEKHGPSRLPFTVYQNALRFADSMVYVANDIFGDIPGKINPCINFPFVLYTHVFC